jgi:endogenous inhibitor of DNA gyrase (YacG/DUF329 family)
MIIKYQKGKIRIAFKSDVIELTKSEYKNFREECRDVDMKIWMEELPTIIKQHQKDSRSSK